MLNMRFDWFDESEGYSLCYELIRDRLSGTDTLWFNYDDKPELLGWIHTHLGVDLVISTGDDLKWELDAKSGDDQYNEFYGFGCSK